MQHFLREYIKRQFFFLFRFLNPSVDLNQQSRGGQTDKEMLHKSKKMSPTFVFDKGSKYEM